MNNNSNGTFLNNHWSWKEFVILFVLTFILAPLLIENYLKSVYEILIPNNFYAGPLMGLTLAVVFLFSIYIVAIKPLKFSWKDVGFRSYSKQYWPKILLWAFGLIGVSIVIILIIEVFSGPYESTKTEGMEQMGTFQFLVAFLSASVVSPFYEEILYRGFFYKWFRNKLGVWPGLLVSSGLFTFAHLPYYNTLPFVFLSGLVFAWAYEKTGSVIPAMIIHSLFNTTALLLTAFA